MTTTTKIIKKGVPAHRCPTCKHKYAEKPEVEKVTVDGISYTVSRTSDGSWVDSPCSCFGAAYRCHSVPLDQCPWHRKRERERANHQRQKLPAVQRRASAKHA